MFYFMKLTYKIILGLIILAVGIILVIVFFTKKDLQEPEDLILSPTPTISTSASPTLTSTSNPSPSTNSGSPASMPTTTPTLTPNLQDPTSIVGRLAPAKCNLTGEIVFIEPNIYESGKAFIEYENIDHEARLITWTVIPEYDFSTGPNIFANLAIPTGKVGLSVSLDDILPIQKEYVVKAKVTYGQLINGDIKLFEAECTGETKIKISF